MTKQIKNQAGERTHTYMIPAKMSNSGSIHDIASDLQDREIKFAPGCKYAVVMASYYGGKGYTTHKTEAAAIAASKAAEEYSHAIIDAEGTRYIIHQGYANDRLIKDCNQ